MPDRTSDAGATQLLPSVRPRVPPRRITRIADQVPLASLYVLIVTLIFFQRFVIPGTALSVALPVAFVVLISLAARGQLVADVSRVALYLAAVAACLLSNVIVSAGAGPEPSVTSLLLLLVLYIPLCFRVSARLREQFPRVLQFFQKSMAVTAVICLLQWAVQLVGLGYEDLFEAYLPPGLIYTDEYNTIYPIEYGVTLLKANGVVFLEPSFASQFLALAIIVQLMLGGHRWRLVLFGAALLTTVSGTGIVLLAVGLVVLAVRRGGQWTARAVLAAFLVALAVSFTPVGELLADRSGESAEAGSSGNARFVAPYATVADAIGNDQQAFLVGRGAGAVDTDLAFFNPLGLEVNYSALPKLIGEYGAPAALIFLVFMLTVLLRNVPSPTLGLMSIALYFVLSGSLLQPQTVYACWLLTGLFAAGRAGEVAGRRIRITSSVSAGEGPALSPGPRRSAPGHWQSMSERTMALTARRPAQRIPLRDRRGLRARPVSSTGPTAGPDTGSPPTGPGTPTDTIHPDRPDGPRGC